MPENNYEMVPLGSTGDKVLGRCMEFVQEGEQWLQAQRPARDWDSVLTMMEAGDPADELKGMSNTGYDLVQRNARDIVASLSNFKHAGEFKPTFSKDLYSTAHMITKLDQNWYTETNAHEPTRSNLQHAVWFGTGYLFEDWDKDYWGTHGDIRLQAFGPQDVTFVQLPRSHDIQKAYAVIIRDEMPLNLAKATYENIASALAPDRERPGWLAKGLERLQRLMGGSPALRLGTMNRNNQKGSFPTVDIFHMYVLDRAINQSTQPVKMGTRGTNWTYNVPALGDPMPTGITNTATGQEFTRPAEPNDCRLFPLRRYCVFSRTAVSYDGSSPWWHGQVPLARTRFNDVAWQALGKSLLSDPRSMQDGIVALMRMIEDASACRLDPPTLYDDQLVSDGFSKTFNLRRAGAKANVSLQSGEVLKPAVPVAHYDVPAGIYQHLKDQENRINHQMGVPDLIAMAKAKQVPGEGTLEKLLEMAGPLVDDMFRALEVPQRQLGEWRKAYYFQFYTQARMIQTTDTSGETEDFQFLPDMIVPPVAGETLAAKRDRTKRFLKEFKYVLSDSSLNERSRMVNKLALLQLKKAGVKIDSWTIAKAWRIANYGPEPEGTNTVIERFLAEAHFDRELAEELQAGQGGNQQGRPPTNKKPPTIQLKDGGARSTVKTS